MRDVHFVFMILGIFIYLFFGLETCQSQYADGTGMSFCNLNTVFSDKLHGGDLRGAGSYEWHLIRSSFSIQIVLILNMTVIL